MALASHSEARAADQDNAVVESDARPAADYSARITKASFQPMAEGTQADVSSRSVFNGEVSLSHGRSKRTEQVSNAAASPMFAPPTPPGSFPINGTGSGFALPNT